MAASTTSNASARTYRLSPPDRTGLMFGLTFPQLLFIGSGIVAGSTLMVTYSVLIGIVVLVLGAGAGAIWLHGASMVELAPQALRFLRQSAARDHSRFQVVPRLGGSDAPTPPVFADQDVVIVDAGPLGVGPPGQRIAISRDAKGGTHAATLRVAGRQFSLTDRGEQDWMVTQWGTALQACIAERTPVVSIRWTEWAAPAGLEDTGRGCESTSTPTHSTTSAPHMSGSSPNRVRRPPATKPWSASLSLPCGSRSVGVTTATGCMPPSTCC